VLEQRALLNQMLTAIKNSKIDITSEKSTKEFAENLTSYFDGGEHIFLYGDMGVGKTTFVRYFINKIQINDKLAISEVTSPTFNLLNEYKTNNLVIKHYDLFRIKNNSEINDLDIFEKNKNTITLVEWPQIIVNKNNAKSIDLLFSYENEFKNRTVQIKVLN
jgi:tRNA threonylcarbamoyladenosine biosynthesis protein TsaE